MTDDQDLREQFARLRQHERLRAPDFARSRVPRKEPRPASAVLTLAIVATLVLSFMLLPGDHGAPVIDLRTTRWIGPTDFLLNVPGDWMLRDVPTIAIPAAPLDSLATRFSS